MFTKKDDYSPEESFLALQKLADFSIETCDSSVSLTDRNRFSQVHLNSSQKMQLNNLLQIMPQATATNTLAQAYVVRFPKGLPHTLSTLKQGGFSNKIRVNGKYAGDASLYPISTQATMLGVFNVLSAVTGQYFLAKINEDLTIVNDKLDDILNFLYGDKKAELMSEIDFVQYAYANYGTIIMHELQCFATISNLQVARKTAIQDVEFYLSDMKNFIEKEAKDYVEVCELTKSALKARECIEMARQLYVMSGILELYYSQNYDDDYLDFFEKDMIRFINKCDKQITALLGRLIEKHKRYRQGTFEKFDNRDRYKSLDQLNELMKPYQDENDSPARIALSETLISLRQGMTYYLDDSGQTYIENK